MPASQIKVWNGYGVFTALVEHDGQIGNASLSSIDIHFGETPLTGIEFETNEHGFLQRLSINLNGSCERFGLAETLRLVAEELKKPIDKLGEFIDVESFHDESFEDISITEKGQAGEVALNSWLQSAGLSYLYVNQSPETFSNLFAGSIKRPDFLVLLESIGLIAVDAKNYTLSKGVFSLPLESELKKVLTFERLFRIPVWYAYLGEINDDKSVWYWISAIKALEVGQVRINSKTQEEFIAIKLEHFERIETNEDLGKLYTHRLPSLKNINSL